MRILAIECETTTQKGGSERSYFDVLTGLQSGGHQVTLLYNRGGDLLDGYQKAGVRAVQSDHVLVLRGGSKLKDFREMYNAWQKAKPLGPFDVIYINFVEAILFARLLKLSFKVPIVCHLRVGYFGLSRQFLWAGKGVSSFIAINKKLKPVFENVFKAPGKVTVVYNGLTIPAQLPSPKQKQVPLKILYLGRIAPEKGVAELAAAFGRAVASGVKATLQITGTYLASHSGDYKAELDAALNASGVRSLITISPAVTDPVNYIAHYDLFVFPSTWDEPFGRALAEAILAGTPILARNVGMVDEIMADNPEFIFKTDEELAEKIRKFSEGQLIFNVDKARERITRDFNKTRMIKEVESILQQTSNA